MSDYMENLDDIYDGNERLAKQDACEHHKKKWYSLTASNYILCLDCGKQFPDGLRMEEEE